MNVPFSVWEPEKVTVVEVDLKMPLLVTLSVKRAGSRATLICFVAALVTLPITVVNPPVR
jgi:hypothetical protein